MRRFIATFAGGVMATTGLVANILVTSGLANGQTLPKFLQEGGPEDAIRQRQNRWTIFIAGGTMGSTWLRFAGELATALDDGNDMRVVPMISRGAAGNLQDLLYLQGVDAAFTQLDVLDYFRTQRKVPNIESRIQYVIRLPVAELHVVSRAGVRTLDDLRGRKVVFGGPGAAAALTGPIVFQRLGIAIEPVFADEAAGLQMLMAGEAAALVGSASKPMDFWLKIPPDAGLHLLPVPFSRALADLYVVGAFSSADYPNLIAPGQRIDTVAVPSVLAVSAAPEDSDRFRRLSRFVQYLFNRWDRLTQPPFHPRWRDVNLAATIPGWTRFGPSEAMLRRPAPDAAAPPPSFEEFKAWLAQEVRSPPRDDAERDAMFRQFLNWREQQHRP